MNKYAQEVYEILVLSYKAIGGIKGINSKEDLVADSDLWKMVRRNGKIVAVCIYTTKRGGRKCIAAGTDGTVTGKRELYNIMKEDISLKDRSAWAEISGAIEKKYVKLGAVPIQAKDAQKIIPDKKFLKINPDGYHYTRMIGGEPHEKLMVGNISQFPLKSLKESE